MQEALSQTWTDFLDANPDDLTSPEDMPDHAYMTGQQFEDWALEAFTRALPAESASAGVVEDEWRQKRVAEVIEEDGGCWRACSGCQESSDGYVSTKDYPYSRVFQCQPGGGCHECGGIGVLWEDGAFLSSYGDAFAASPVPPSVPEEVERLREAEALVAELQPLVDKAAGPNGWDWMFPLREVPVDGKPTIVSHRGGNLFRGYIATWEQSRLLIALANAAPRILAALTTPSSPANADGESA